MFKLFNKSPRPPSVSELLETVARGDLEATTNALAAGYDPNTANSKGATALHMAAIEGSVEIVTMLINAGANVDAMDNEGLYPLRLAVANGHAKVVELLLSATPALNGTGPQKTAMPILAVAALNAPELLPVLIAAGADPSIGPINNKYPEINAWLEQAGRPPLRFPLPVFAAKAGHWDAVALLLNWSPLPDAFHGWLLRFAFDAGPEQLRRVSELGVNIDALEKENRDKQTMLHRAVEADDVERTRLLLSLGANPDIPMQLAIIQLEDFPPQKRAELELLVKYKNPYVAMRNGQTALHLASEKPELMQLLLDAGGNPNATTVSESPIPDPISTGNTPLHFAATAGSDEVVKILLAHGANPDPRNAQQETPLHGAAREGFLGVVQMLLDAGADPDPKDDQGSTPLLLVELHRSTSTVVVDTIDSMNSDAMVNEWRDRDAVADLLRARGATMPKEGLDEVRAAWDRVHTELATEIVTRMRSYET